MSATCPSWSLGEPHHEADSINLVPLYGAYFSHLRACSPYLFPGVQLLSKCKASKESEVSILFSPFRGETSILQTFRSLLVSISKSDSLPTAGGIDSMPKVVAEAQMDGETHQAVTSPDIPKDGRTRVKTRGRGRPKAMPGAAPLKDGGAGVKKGRGRPKATMRPPLLNSGGTSNPGRKKKKNMSNKRQTSYKTYVNKVMMEIHPDMSISAKAMKVLDHFLLDMFDRIASEAGKLARNNRKPTLAAHAIQTAVRLILPSEMSRLAVAQGFLAIKKYTTKTEV